MVVIIMVMKQIVQLLEIVFLKIVEVTKIVFLQKSVAAHNV